VRLDKVLIRQIEEEARQEKTDKSKVARKLVAIGIEQARRSRAIEDYRKGKCAVWKASEKAGVSLREMMELLRREEIPLHLSAEDAEQAWREAPGR
jgi:predicted HTH domain antitoxin